MTRSIVDMAACVHLLSETVKEAQKAVGKYDVETFQRMMKDKAKAASGKEQ